MTNNLFVLDKIKALVQKVAPKGSLVILFGSRARGDAKQDSDWDILIVLPKKTLVQEDYDEVSYPLVELGWELNEQINPIMYTKDEWEASSITPFYDNVQRDGIKLVA
ncbi:MAG: nucleotidyltransferase domain-containing protein [Prevotella sp.]|nr:nucleotidyltransferase domain-containing protein [Prevotella sp.]